MATTLIWKPYVRPEPPEVTPQALLELEHQWKVVLPEEYKRLVSRHQGMTPEPCLFNIGKGKNVFCALLVITQDERWDAYSIQREYEALRTYVPPGIHPFGTTSGGESLCFDYRDGGDEPRIVLVTVEGEIHRIAENFSDFLTGLHD